MINAVLSSLPVYYLSFYKAPKKVLDKIIQIQRRFMWGGSEECRKICWVKWDVVCCSREEGGLGIRNLKAFNLALLGKWRWSFFTEKESTWSRVLRVRYGDPNCWRVQWSVKTLEGGGVLFGGMI